MSLALLQTAQTMIIFSQYQTFLLGRTTTMQEVPRVPQTPLSLRF